MYKILYKNYLKLLKKKKKKIAYFHNQWKY